MVHVSCTIFIGALARLCRPSLVLIAGLAGLIAGCDFGEAGITPVAQRAAPLAGCGKVTGQGCCQGGAVWFCEAKKLKLLSCAGNPKCGWAAAYNLYDCGTSGGADPAGKHPRPCAALVGDAGLPQLDAGSTDSGPPKEAGPAPDLAPAPDTGPGCGKVTTQGCCDGATLWYCSSGALTKVHCGANLKCGWDPGHAVYDCGTAGSADPAAKHPMACATAGDAAMPASDGATADSAPPQVDAGLPCGQITLAGCCDGETLWYCSNGALNHYSCQGKPKCGWQSVIKWYYCGTGGASDPSGKLPKSCGTVPATDSGPPEFGPDLAQPDLPAVDLAGPDLPGPDLAGDVGGDHPATPDSALPDIEQDEGCGCRVAAPPSTLPLLALMVVALVLGRRRARHRRNR